MQRCFIPNDYKPLLGVRETQMAIKRLKDFFESALARELNLTRASAPMFVTRESGLNDNLSGIERPVAFDALSLDCGPLEVVHSLAKWKRMALHRYGFAVGSGLYTDMNAIRRDEELDNTHSIYVDQWDWEKVISRAERTQAFLRKVVSRIYKAFLRTEQYLFELYPELEPVLPAEIFFIGSQELEDRYPSLPPKERENAIAREKGAVFIQQIGGKLSSGTRHDGRAPDYDDWSLNGDIIFWFPVLDIALELSSMGIRVDAHSLAAQLRASRCEERRQLDYHSKVLSDVLPLTVGGGIGQSRICMFFLRKAHIGEVQASVWPEETVAACEKAGITLL
ncbi:MAG: Aspartate--ammonia ligase [Firmicutes bacterium]|nr:Aspartate--ammonia ligase [Bacillota bacterium]